MANEQRKLFLLRISPELLEKLEKWAVDWRSVNGQIECILCEAVNKRKYCKGETIVG